MLLVNTFDVEPWWATVPPCVPDSEWPSLPDRSEAPLHQHLDLCEESGVRCTFFFLGWYAQRFPERVREVVRRGHEVGCHSMSHRDVGTLDVRAFREDTLAARSAIEDAAGVGVTAYRAPSFSFPPERVVELTSTLVELGFELDSSICTARRIHGGGFAAADYPGPESLQARLGVPLFEVPVPGTRLLGGEPQLFGGGYLRLAPPALLERLVRSESYQVLYVHPHDFDTDLPPLPGAGWLANARRRARVGDLSDKLRMLFRRCEVRACGELLAAEAAVAS